MKIRKPEHRTFKAATPIVPVIKLSKEDLFYSFPEFVEQFLTQEEIEEFLLTPTDQINSILRKLEWSEQHWVPFVTESELLEFEDDNPVLTTYSENQLIVTHYPSPATLENLLFEYLVNVPPDNALQFLNSISQNLDPLEKRLFFLKVTERTIARRLLKSLAIEKSNDEYNEVTLRDYAVLVMLEDFMRSQFCQSNIRLPVSGLPAFQGGILLFTELFGAVITSGKLGTDYDKIFTLLVQAFQVQTESHALKFQPYFRKLVCRDFKGLPQLQKFIDKVRDERNDSK